MAHTRPIIGITADANSEKFLLSRTYVDCVAGVGGAPVILPCSPQSAADFVRICDGFILSGGDDPITTHWGIPQHPKSRPLDPQRQAFEIALLDALALSPETPTLGICLGMQLMGLHGGGAIDQHLADTHPSADLHCDKSTHEVDGELGHGIVHSHHRQALTDAGSLQVISRSSDGLIEAVRGDGRPFYVGVQWHPERTADPTLGIGLIERLVQAAASYHRSNVARKPVASRA